MPRAARSTLPVLASSILLTGLLASCSQGSGTPGAAATQAAPATTATTTTATAPTTPAAPAMPVLLTTKEAGARYLEITRPYNEALEGFERGFNAGESVRTLQRRAQVVADTAAKEARALESTPWPTAVAPLMMQLAETDARLHHAWTAVAEAETKEAMLAEVRGLPSGADTGAKIRALLGLPKYDENDY